MNVLIFVILEFLNYYLNNEEIVKQAEANKQYSQKINKKERKKELKQAYCTIIFPL